MQEQWVRNISFVVPILCAAYICFALAAVLGHICYLLPLTLSNNIIFLFLWFSKYLQIPQWVCKVEMWNLALCVSFFVIAAIVWGPYVNIMEREITFRRFLYARRKGASVWRQQARRDKQTQQEFNRRQLEKVWGQRKSALTFDDMSEEDGIWVSLTGWLSLYLIRQVRMEWMTDRLKTE